MTNLPVPDQAQLDEVVAYLVERGAAAAEIAEALGVGALGELALELALRGPGAQVAFEQASRQTGLEPEAAGRLWRALGFPDPFGAPTTLGPAEVEALGLFRAMGGDVFGADTGMQFARVVGYALALVAQTLVDSFRVEVEVPQREAGATYLDVVQNYSETAATLLPSFVAVLDTLLRRHIVTAARGLWAVDEERATVTRDVTIGFVDLVGYSAASQTLSPRELALAVGNFDERASELISAAGGRVVKLIGDEAMFVVDDATRAAALALELARTFGADPGLQPVRVGLAAGPVVALRGDFYGDVVNLAARLVKSAAPSSVVASASLRAAAGDRFTYVPLAPLSLKGIAEPVEAFELRGSEEG